MGIVVGFLLFWPKIQEVAKAWALRGKRSVQSEFFSSLFTFIISIQKLTYERYFM